VNHDTFERTDLAVVGKVERTKYVYMLVPFAIHLGRVV
jgi:hypothetical protein